MGEYTWANLQCAEVLRKEKEKEIAPTVREGDCTYLGDIRTLVGVLRWKKEGMNDLPKDYFSENRTNLVLDIGLMCGRPDSML